jgi:hypothetical protein
VAPVFDLSSLRSQTGANLGCWISFCIEYPCLPASPGQRMRTLRQDMQSDRENSVAYSAP